MKIVILVLLLLIVISLFAALYAFIKDKGQSNRMVNALYVRVGFSIVLIIFLVVGHQLGYLKTNMNPAMVDKIVDDKLARQKIEQQKMNQDSE